MPRKKLLRPVTATWYATKRILSTKYEREPSGSRFCLIHHGLRFCIYCCNPLYQSRFCIIFRLMETTKEKVKILSAGAISAMLRRMAYEIYERNFTAKSIVLMGIGPRGAFLASRIQKHLTEISPLTVFRADLVKVADSDQLAWESPTQARSITDSPVLIVDDVLYSGGTVVQALFLAYALKPIKIQTAFLIDRGHRQFPVTHDYVGMEMATSLKQYISVDVDPVTERAEAFIF